MPQAAMPCMSLHRGPSQTPGLRDKLAALCPSMACSAVVTLCTARSVEPLPSQLMVCDS